MNDIAWNNIEMMKLLCHSQMKKSSDYGSCSNFKSVDCNKILDLQENSTN